ncbi:MAG TPA: glycosyl hydrolase [Bacteroidia bacterium]|nr:glycosyl hydrolase [Bacteroidia bacterium]
MKKALHLAILLQFCVAGLNAQSKQKSETKNETAPAEKKVKPFLNPDTYSALSFRNLGPAVTSGRVSDIAVHPKNPSTWYIAAASGGVFKTQNAGVTFEPVFDKAGAYSIGCISIDPSNPNVIWVGSGENNNQRSVAYGDGVYKSEDGGKSFKNMGLGKSEHIGKIVIDPNNSDIVYVAAYGPLWSPGGERGIYKSSDGGKTWKQVLFVSENTGFNEVHMDPRNSSVLYACAHQRRRHEWTYISGGPESAVYKSTDAGTTWNKLSTGLPTNDMGRIGLAISPVNPDVLYAIVEATEGKGVYRSEDRGASWTKQGDWATAGNYYQELVADPFNENTVYSLDFNTMISENGGKTFRALGEKSKHVDNHAFYIFPNDAKHMLMGCDGGLYESFDGAKTWQFKANLPITQFYRVCADNSKPFYYVYGGTQDNNTLGGPARTISASGITNADWFVTVGGDGFQSRVDPKDPNIVYSQWQYGGLIRFDRKNGEQVSLKPMEKQGEAANRWNWDSPLIISAFDNKRLYFASQKIYRSDDRGDSWTVISPDLSRGIDRNKLAVMDKVWSVDAVAKNQSTSIFGNIVSLCESPLNEKLLYAGTDDGLIQVSENGGQTWTRYDKFPGVPELNNRSIVLGTFVQYLVASQHKENVVYAAFNNLRQGDFKPYLLKSSDKGKTWTSIAANLPERGSVYCIAEDHKNPALLFCGTEFGFYFSPDGGGNWVKFTNGMPSSISVRDIAIQKDENDLVLATFGRGIYVLDDYSMLQNMKEEDFTRNTIFPVKDGLLYIESRPYGHRGKAFQGESFFTAKNPPVGPVFNLYSSEEYKSLRDKRREAEKEKIKNKQDVFYPSADSLRLEDNEIAPTLCLEISDESGQVLRKLKLNYKKGTQRVNWDGRLEPMSPVSFSQPDTENPYYEPDQGPAAVPGKYYARLIRCKTEQTEAASEKVGFVIRNLDSYSLPPLDRKKQAELNSKLAEFRRVVLGSADFMRSLKERQKYLKEAQARAGAETKTMSAAFTEFETRYTALDLKLFGDRSLAKREFETVPGFVDDMEGMVYYTWTQSYGSSKNLEDKFKELKEQFGSLYKEIKELRRLIESLESGAEALKMPATAGRLPDFN